ncbi:Zinc finger Y-chromosomal protein [Harpegnathos saltator]|uniref:Zinc finger Y-chromosomal protein n=2 Tax=Harpegnathos saltator TaxID=610380 RepID=E2C184_HARSA|nr:Zinc finger Y-chromosomal protein [Harpegnathos saltator]
MSHCDYETNDEENVQSHIRDHSNEQEESNIIDPEPSLESDPCCKHFNRNNCIENNMLHECDVCNQRFRRKNELTNHLMEEHKDLMHQYEQYNYDTNDEEVLQSHTHNHSNKQEESNIIEAELSLESDPCGKHSSRNSCIESNMPHECDVCNQSFRRKNELANQLMENYKDSMHQYEHCNYETNDEEELKSQIRDHIKEQEESNIINPKPSLKSNPCGKHSNRNSCIENNMPHECDVCNQRFHRKQEMIHHLMKVHKRKLYRCSLCNYDSNQKEHYQYHIIRVHENNYNYICPEQGCIWKFKVKRDLTRHIRFVHSNKQKERNSAGSKPSSQNDSCGKHSNKNGSNEIYKKNPTQCLVCNQRFSKKQKLMHHLMEVHGCRTTFNCSDCKYGSNRRNDLQKHIARMHSYDYVCTEAGCNRKHKKVFGKTHATCLS